MAIVDHEHTRQLEFGFGDIKVSPGMLDTDEVIGVVVFQNQDARPIGDHEDHVPNRKLDISESPVRMTFEKLESIDVVIWALQETKRMMLEKSGLNGNEQIPRESVQWFAEQMEIKLRENDHKGGWDNCGIFWLLNQLVKEVKELSDAMNSGHNSESGLDLKNIIREASDVANFAMMIADKAKQRLA